ncbi:hypothetical protein BASA81_004476 [Batrachochytrium salamandrivorans]|nr:hypothetical protein BASA81_004476 [Batrachochytrium salamandrivorans]
MLFELFKAGLLVANGLAVLHQERFLALYDLHIVDHRASEQGQLKAQLAGFLMAVQWMRVPLIFLNIISIALIVLFG